jgi:hypothetical protein
VFLVAIRYRNLCLGLSDSSDHKPILSSAYKFGEFQTNMDCIQEMLKVEIKQETVILSIIFNPL